MLLVRFSLPASDNHRQFIMESWSIKSMWTFSVIIVLLVCLIVVSRWPSSCTFDVMEQKAFLSSLVTLNTTIPIATPAAFASLISQSSSEPVTTRSNVIPSAPPAIANPVPKSEIPETPMTKMMKRIQNVLAACKELCDMRRPVTPGVPFGTSRSPVDCGALFREVGIDAPRETPKAPYDVPQDYIDNVTMHGRIKWSRFVQHLDDAYLGKTALVPNWPRKMVDEWTQQASTGNLNGNYGHSETRCLMEGVRKADVQGKKVLVIGSESPWVEAVCLAAGAEHVTTLEYGVIKTDHPKLSTMTPPEFREAYLTGKLPIFDHIVTFSSLEHPGLGRYGDALNPWGDILAIARAWCVTKDDGKLVVGLPYGEDAVEFNAHRVYGPVRYPVLATNWKLIHAGCGVQKVHVFDKLT